MTLKRLGTTELDTAFNKTETKAVTEISKWPNCLSKTRPKCLSENTQA